MPEKSKSLFDLDVLKEEVLKELYMLPETVEFSPEDSKLAEECTELMLQEWARLPFLEGWDLKNAQATIKHGKAAFGNIAVIKRIDGQQALVYALQSVLMKAVKVAVAI